VAYYNLAGEGNELSSTIR